MRYEWLERWGWSREENLRGWHRFIQMSEEAAGPTRARDHQTNEASLDHLDTHDDNSNVGQRIDGAFSVLFPTLPCSLHQ